MQEIFKNVRAVLTFLNDEGYKVGRDKIYSDGKSGLLKVQKKKSVLEVAKNSVLASDVWNYLKTLKKVDLEDEDLTGEQRVKTRKEIEKLDLQNAKLQFELDKDRGRYLKKKDFAMEVSARAIVLETGARHMFQVNVSEYIALVGGDPLKANLLLDRMDADFDQTMNGFATTERFQVMIVPGSEDTE